ncbi:hypothetical protein [Frigidibacter sp. SD6-1]|uniref:hypothetical protein n=1 Tax=Frigidibacter sp. SD6-1 TaxID=3032581 RepID=UPI0024E00E47|nr:hypothetical protein [Frigidibacter sp. SD6-1]
MSLIRTASVAILLGLAALPAAAGGFSFDIPRLDFPTDAGVTRGCTGPATQPVGCAGAEG